MTACLFCFAKHMFFISLIRIIVVRALFLCAVEIRVLLPVFFFYTFADKKKRPVPRRNELIILRQHQ